MQDSSEKLKEVMRHWTTGVTIVSSAYKGKIHGMTVNSFTSISIDPPMIVVTLAKNTRTHDLVQDSGKFGVSLLSVEQFDLSDKFAGRVPEGENRFEGIDVFYLSTDIPLINGGLAWVECEVVQVFDLPASTMFIGQVTASKTSEGEPLVYYNRAYHSLGA
jgi:flavin reductase (DIM6/NTAB) family NADH-FMN oxidoreductase RutF